MSTLTYAETLGKHQITIPADLVADAEVPVLTSAQCQGDVGIFPRPALGTAELSAFNEVPTTGIPVVRGENNHILDAYDGPVLWRAVDDDTVTVGIVHVPEGSTATLTHTDEHGTNAMGPGTYRITGKREQADEIRRVAD